MVTLKSIGSDNSRFSICEASLDDCSRIRELSTQLSYEVSVEDLRLRLMESLENEDSTVLLATDPSGYVVGCLEVGEHRSLIDGLRVQILALVVDAHTRREGVGRLLVGAACEWAKARGHTRISVRSNAIRKEAHSFYPGLGFSLQKTQHLYELVLQA